MVELYTEFEGNEFVLERLPSGSIINQRVLFMEDLMYVNMRASKTLGAHILELNKDGLEILTAEYEDLRKKIMMFEN